MSSNISDLHDPAPLSDCNMACSRVSSHPRPQNAALGCSIAAHFPVP